MDRVHYSNQPSSSATPPTPKSARALSPTTPSSSGVRPAKPSTLPVLRDNFPLSLCDTDHWVGYQWVWKDDRWAKVPITPGSGKWASPTDARTWGSLAVAII